MSGAGIPQEPGVPSPDEQSHETPSQPRSGSGADTALQALIRKRQMHAGSEPTLPGDGSKLPLKK
jgi:hypothetical protein